MNGRGTLERRSYDRRDAEIARLKREVEALRERERAARREAEDARRHFSELSAMSRRFAHSMRAGVGERQQYRRRLAAQYAVSRVLAEAHDLDEAAPRIFEIFGERLGWHLGVLWTLDRQAGVLRRAGIWRTRDIPPGAMEEACEDMRLRRGESLPGRVWEREEPVWVEDVLADEDFLRNGAAVEDDLRGAFAFPIREGGFVGVFEFFQREVLPPDEDLLRTAGLVGDQIGQFLERRQAEEELRASEERQAFLLKLSDALRPLGDPIAIQETASRLVGEHLGVDRAAYAELEPGDQIMTVARDWTSPGTSSVSGKYRLDDFGKFFTSPLREGRASAIEDASTDPRVSRPMYESTWGSIGVRSAIGYPLVKQGRFVAAFFIHESDPRAWSQREVSLVAEVGERTWEAVERARAERAVEEDLEDTRVLRDLGARLVSEDDVQVLYDEVMAVAVALTRADAGTVQILDDETQELVLLATQGFERNMTEHFYRVDESSNTPCGLALTRGERSFVDFDVPEGEDPDGSMRMHVEAGYLSAQSTPLFARSGRIIGMVSTHWREHRRLTERELRFLDLLARQAADLIEQWRSDKALRESEERYRVLFDSIDEGFCTIEVLFDEGESPIDYRFLQVNEAFARQSGIENAAGRRMREIAPQHEGHWFEIYGRVAMTGEPVRFENRAEQLERWFDVYAFRVEDPRLRRVGILFKDVTERKQAEERLRRAAELDAFRVSLTDALRPLSDPIEIQAEAARVLGEGLGVTRALYIELDEGGENLTVERYYHGPGVPRMAGRYRLDDFGPALIAELRAGSVLAVADVREQPVLTQDERATYAAMDIVAHVTIPLVKEGRLVALLSIHDAEPREWTADEIALVEETAERTWSSVERARAEEALRESEERFRQFAENSEDVLWILDAETRQLEYLSPAYERIWGEPRGAVLDDLERWGELVHPEDRERAGEGMSRLLAGETFSQEYRIVRPVDGEERWILDTGFPITDEAGRTRRVGGVAQDITERKETEEERERFLAREWRARAEAEERKRISRELHDRVAHAMGVVHQSLELYEVFKERNAEQAEAKMKLARETTREALDLTRNLSRELHNTEAKDGLSAALSNLLKTTVPPGLEANVSIEGDESLTPPRVREQLFLILREAVRNAVSHSNASRLGIEVEVSPERVVGCVEDDGRGIEGTVEGNNGVSGSGLKSMEERAELVGGTVKVSSAPGTGTRIEASMPLSQTAQGGGQETIEGTDE